MRRKKKKILLGVLTTLLAAGGVITVLSMMNPSSPVRRSSISLVEDSDPDETGAEPEGTDPRKIEAATTEPSGPSYPVVELEVPEIERIDTDIILEAEEAAYTGLLSVETLLSGFSGEGYLAGFNLNPGDAVEAACTIDAAQHYDITISVYADTAVTNALAVNGERIGTFTIDESGHFVRVTFSGVYLPKGDVTLSIQEIDGQFALDYFEISDYDEMYQMEYRESYELSDPSASPNAQKLMDYMGMHYGAKVLTGQYAAGSSNTEADVIFQLTGKYPAIRFSDLAGYTKNSTAQKTDAIAASQAWWERGGIVGLIWHWDAPMGVSSVYAEETDFSLMDALTDEDLALLTQEEIDELYDNDEITEECYTILRDIDTVSEELKVLAEQDIPVLWRPLHEASGDWFWWGADGAPAYRWLWKLLYTRMTEYHGLHNLIWIWNGQSADYLVNAEMYDIASLDIYLPADKTYSSRYEQYVLLSRMTKGEKMLALSETSSIPDMNDMFRDHCIWSFFGLWYGEYLIGEDGAFSEKYTSADAMVSLYNSEAALTLKDTVAYFLDGEEPEEIEKATVAPTQPTEAAPESTEETDETEA